MCFLNHTASLRVVGIGVLICLMTVACARVEYSAPKRHYAVEKQESANEMHLNRLSKTKDDPFHWGTLHFENRDSEKDDITVDLGKEKSSYKPSRYFARTKLPEINGKSVGFTFSVDSKRDAWMGFEMKIKKDFWSPAGALNKR